MKVGCWLKEIKIISNQHEFARGYTSLPKHIYK